MAKEATFKFTGKDNVSEALKTINKNVQNVSKATKDAAKSINRVNIALTALKAVANAVGKVISVAFNTIKKLVSAGLNTLKSLISGTFKFIKSALSTLLSWTVKALGKVFDGVKNLFNNILNFTKQAVIKTTALVKKGVKAIIDSVKGYAEDEYNEIQLKVSLGDSYDQVMKSFNKLLRYTTSSDDELLSAFATFAEVGKKPEEIEKYAKASIYMANATGRSLSQITRLLLGQEAAGTDLERLLHRLGINISEQEQSISNIDKIIRQLEPEMEALANNSLKQLFSNVKNDLATIQDTIGAIFSGPVRYVAQSLDKLLTKLIGSNKIAGLTDKLQKVFDDHIKPVVDKVFEFLEKFIMDPKGFFEALWKDIKQIGQNFLDNFASIMGSLGLVFGTLFNKLFNFLGNINFSKIFGDLTDALNSFILNFGAGIGWWSQEDIDKAEGSVKNLFINAWNDAHPNFTLSKDDKWYEFLGTLFSGLWDDLKPLLDKVIGWVKNTLAPILGEVFTWLGDVLSAAFTNFLLQSEVLRKIMSAIGMPIATRQDQENSYEIFKEWLPKDIVDGHAWRPFKSTDLTSEFLKSPYPGKDFTGTWGKYLEVASSVSGKITGEALDILRRISRADTITENAKVPTVGDLITRIDNVLNPVTKAVTEVEDKLPHNYKNLYEDLHDDIRGKLIPELTEEEKATKELVRELKSHVTVLHVIPTSTGYGSGGIQDYYGQNEFKIKPYSNGGPVTHPTIALLGEDGDEYVLSNKMLKGLVKPNLPPLPGPSDRFAGGGRTTGGGGINDNPGWFLDKNGTWREDTPINRMLDDLDILKPIADAVTTIGKDVTNVSTWFKDAETLPEVVNEIESDLNKDGRSNLRKFWDAVKDTWKNKITNSEWWSSVIEDGYYSMRSFFKDLEKVINLVGSFTWDDWELVISKVVKGIGSVLGGLVKGSFKGVGILAQNGGFGSHIENIYKGAFDENGSFSIMKAFSALIEELLPYLREGLEIIGPLFDQAFEIFGSAVQILGERLGQQLLPILEAFIPLMKLLADIIVALAPVAESILKPAITVIAAILQALVPILEFLMPAFAGIGAVIQTVSESINWVIAKLLNWLAGIHIGNWYPFSGLGYRDPGTVHGVGENYRAIMSQYEAARANTSTGVATTSVGTAGQTASYSGSNHIYITNEFGGSYIVGSGGMRELALIIKNTLEDLDYAGQTI